MLISLKVKFLILTDSIDREEERKMMREREGKITMMKSSVYLLRLEKQKQQVSESSE